MSGEFFDIWKRLVAICAAQLPWESIVDFHATDWPSLYGPGIPDGLGMADYSSLVNRVATRVTVTLGSRKVELNYLKSAQLWRVFGFELVASEYVLRLSFSPDANGIGFRGDDKLERLAETSFTWLKGG